MTAEPPPTGTPREAAFAWLNAAGQAIDDRGDPATALARALTGIGFALLALSDDKAKNA